MGLFRPTVRYARITDITIEDLRRMAVQGILLDVDNTLTTHYCPDLSDEVAAWLAAVQAAGIRLTVVSNAKRYRVEPFAAKIGLSCVWLAAKPLPFGFWRGMHRLGVRRRHCLAIGDQTFTDTVGAKLAGVRVVQLTPIQLEEDKPFMMFKRRIEAYILKKEARK
ncbi:MAG: YqeG family HAD IIIA-type phosphatase [Ruminococcaceae bacterium]|nr:YqeG family HAD IIIA-type phosphatase [Oscillospiraceae bacterium]